MVSILDQVALTHSVAFFRPTTVGHVFALRLAQKLGEPSAAQHYVDLAQNYSDETMLLAYRKTFFQSDPAGSFGRRFHMELASINEQAERVQSDRLLAI